MAEMTRQKKIQPDDLRGGRFITNLGGIGGTSFSPIVNCRSRHSRHARRLQPVILAQVVPRLLLPLSLSYDHRVIDGAPRPVRHIRDKNVVRC